MESIAERVLKTVAERGGRYGHPADNHQLTADLWTAWLRGRGVLTAEQLVSPEDVCMLNCMQKQARLANGHHEDSWLDIAGYAENVAMLRPGQLNKRAGT